MLYVVPVSGFNVADWRLKSVTEIGSIPPPSGQIFVSSVVASEYVLGERLTSVGGVICILHHVSGRTLCVM